MTEPDTWTFPDAYDDPRDASEQAFDAAYFPTEHDVLCFCAECLPYPKSSSLSADKELEGIAAAWDRLYAEEDAAYDDSEPIEPVEPEPELIIVKE